MRDKKTIKAIKKTRKDIEDRIYGPLRKLWKKYDWDQDLGDILHEINHLLYASEHDVKPEENDSIFFWIKSEDEDPPDPEFLEILRKLTTGEHLRRGK